MATNSFLLASSLQSLSITGGDVCEAYCAILEKGGKVFVKIHDNAKMLHAESIGLDWLSSAGCETPSVLAVSSPNSQKGYLVLSWVDSRHPVLPDWEDFGQQLSALHSTKEQECGWSQDNFLGELHQSNRQSPNWIEFFRDRRLIPQMKKAIDSKQASINLAKKLDPLLQRLQQRLIVPRTISRLHGDLWHGNIMFQKNVGALLIDPSPYAGHREMDFAMMELFGGFHPRVYAAYEDRFPLQPGWRERVPIYQLYYLLAHVNLHGASWMGQVYSTIDQIV